MNIDMKSFAQDGIIALRGFIPRQSVSKARNSILEELTRLKLKVNGKFTSKIRDLPIFQQTGRLGQQVGPQEDVDNLFNDEILGVINTFGTAKLKPAHPHAQILLSFPHQSEWSLKKLNWHLDLTPPELNHVPGVQAFVLIDDVEAQGGATLALAGSHQLHYTKHRGSAHEVLQRHSDFAQNPEKYLKPQFIEEKKIQIIEMYGKAGDVFLMDLRVLHSPSINARRNMRMMATNRYLNMSN